jgi:hypothetical protein
LRLIHVEDNKSNTLSLEIKTHVRTDVQKVMADEFQGYPLAMIGAGIHGTTHHTIRHKDKICVRGDVHTNTVESAFLLFKRGLTGSFHQVSLSTCSIILMSSRSGSTIARLQTSSA